MQSMSLNQLVKMRPLLYQYNADLSSDSIIKVQGDYSIQIWDIFNLIPRFTEICQQTAAHVGN